MRTKLSFLGALVLGAFGGVLATSCQTYDFEPVDPLAISQTTKSRRVVAKVSKPNLMLLVDKSASMTAPVNPSLPACKLSDGKVCGDSEQRPCNTAVCPTRWSELQGAMQDFLKSSGSLARFGLATYPAGNSLNSCDPSSKVEVALPAASVEDVASLEKNAEDVKNAILAIKNSSTTGELVPRGGTPTSESLAFLGKLNEMQTGDRSDFVLLLTDGLPNCNRNFPTPAPSPDCFCTLSASCSAAPQIGCLDANASVTAVQDLRNKEIQTIVIGFGADFDASSESGRRGAETLNQMAVVGGFNRTCARDVDCGTGDTCDTAAGLCKRRFFQASNRAELVSALRDISNQILVQEPCLFAFEDDSERPDSQELVVVYVDGERLSPGVDWSLTEEGISFAGATCERLKNSTEATPVNVEVRTVQRR
ncbi:adventurous gliding motility lipoprotein CglB [Archangium violaceum]|uniref:adventurous gliding motility lipoprotein CglB n=1 Tax=Archangium violaceum TaxID=83451 RepID=UPI002B2E96BA|nr:adventurous gliding motility lipoprotein CglB [Archangium violaceum]